MLMGGVVTHEKCSESQISCYVTYIYLSVYSNLSLNVSHIPKNENLVKKMSA